MSVLMNKNEVDSSEAGYVLLEILIGSAVSSTLLFLLLASLTSLGKSQDRALRVVETASHIVFERTVANHFFGSIRPTYRSEEGRFTGTATSFTGRTYLAGVSETAGQTFEARLISVDRRSVLIAELDDRRIQLAASDINNCVLRYGQHGGQFFDAWTDDIEFERGGPSERFIKYADPIPNQVKLECQGVTIGVWRLDATNWPPPRQNDIASTLVP